MPKHFHVCKATAHFHRDRETGIVSVVSPSHIKEHNHTLIGVIANHSHEALFGFATTQTDAELLRDFYDHHVCVAHMARHPKRLDAPPSAV